MFLNEYMAQLNEALGTVGASVYALALTLQKARETGAVVFTCGNGGSHSNAQHLAQDLCKGAAMLGRPALNTYHLGGNPAELTARANDDGYVTVFSGDLEARGKQGDVLIAISGSGNSPNVLNAVHMAHELEMRTWGIVGFDGGQLINIAHRCIHVQSDNMGIVEVAHDAIFHWLTETLAEITEASTNTAGAWCPGVEIR